MGSIEHEKHLGALNSLEVEERCMQSRTRVLAVGLCCGLLCYAPRASADRNELQVGLIWENDWGPNGPPPMWRGAVAQPQRRFETRLGARAGWGLTHRITLSVAPTLSLNPTLRALQWSRGDTAPREVQLHHRALVVPLGVSWTAAQWGMFFAGLRLEGGAVLRRYTWVQMRIQQDLGTDVGPRVFAGDGRSHIRWAPLARLGLVLLWRASDTWGLGLTPYCGSEGWGDWQAGAALEVSAMVPLGSGP